ncbi:MAG: hypothetical protein HY659_10675 [Rhizobiales bacterium]|nr:hypothetical protein [Hyphomicrobiales bacterium]
MWWPDPRVRTCVRLAAVLAMAMLTAGCFQPLYGERSFTTAAGGPGLRDRLSAVEVQTIDTPSGTPVARIGGEIRNALMFDLTGGGAALPATHRLKISLSTQTLSVIVDTTTARPDVSNYGIDATYALVEIATGKTVANGRTFSRVSYDIPGQEQRFAAARGLRDAENRAAKVIAEQIKSRLASYFVTGS